MAVEWLAGRVIKGERDIEHVSGTAEKKFARFLLDRFPHLRIIIEPTFFKTTDDQGRILSGTIPDFYIENPRNPRVGGIFVEITLGYVNGTDPKARQKRVMAREAPAERYVVLYRNNLAAIEGGHLGVDLTFNSSSLTLRDRMMSAGISRNGKQRSE